MNLWKQDKYKKFSQTNAVVNACGRRAENTETQENEGVKYRNATNGTFLFIPWLGDDNGHFRGVLQFLARRRQKNKQSNLWSCRCFSRSGAFLTWDNNPESGVEPLPSGRRGGNHHLDQSEPADTRARLALTRARTSVPRCSWAVTKPRRSRRF